MDKIRYVVFFVIVAALVVLVLGILYTVGRTTLGDLRVFSRYSVPTISISNYNETRLDVQKIPLEKTSKINYDFDI